MKNEADDNLLASPMHTLCTFKTPPCLPTPRAHALQHVRVMQVHTGTFWTDTHHTPHRITRHNTTQHDTPHHTTITRPQHHTETEKEDRERLRGREKRKKTETERREDGRQKKTRQDEERETRQHEERREKRQVTRDEREDERQDERRWKKQENRTEPQEIKRTRTELSRDQENLNWLVLFIVLRRGIDLTIQRLPRRVCKSPTINTLKKSSRTFDRSWIVRRTNRYLIKKSMYWSGDRLCRQRWKQQCILDKLGMKIRLQQEHQFRGAQAIVRHHAEVDLESGFRDSELGGFLLRDLLGRHAATAHLTVDMFTEIERQPKARWTDGKVLEAAFFGHSGVDYRELSLAVVVRWWARATLMHKGKRILHPVFGGRAESERVKLSLWSVKTHDQIVTTWWYSSTRRWWSCTIRAKN